jgi:hypothetical protein
MPMRVERAVERALRERPDLVREARDSVPKAWGRLAALGVRLFRAEEGRPPTDEERRAIWHELWRGVESAERS